MTNTDHDPDRDYYWSSIFFIFIVPALGGLLFGYDIGATSFAVVESPLLSSSTATATTTTTTTTSPALIGLFVSMPSAGALVGSVIVYFIADKIGRLNELRIGSMFYIIGAILESNTSSFAIVLCGRLLYGLGIGFSMHGAPTYLGEMLPSRIRGAFVSLKEVFIVLGILLGYIAGYVFAESSDNFIYLYLLSLIGSSMMLLLSFSIPYSTRWLLSKGRNQEARKALRYIYYDPDSKYNSLIVAYNEQQQRSSSSSCNDDSSTATNNNNNNNNNNNSIFHPSRRAALTAGIGLVVLQQVTGQPSVLSYATPMFEAAGLDSFSSVLVALFKLVATTTAVFTVEYYGRKQLLYVGCSLMLLALVVLTITLGGDTTLSATADSDNNGDINNAEEDESTSTIRTTAILIAMFVYIGGYQVGFGPMSWLIMSEVFPQSIRGQAVAVAVQVNFLLNAIVQFGVPVLASWWGLSTTFMLFGILTAYSIYFVYRYVLETKGLSLEEIEHMFRDHNQGGGRQQQQDGRKTTSHISGSGSDGYNEDEEQQQLLTEMQPTRRISKTRTREGNVPAGKIQSPYQK